MCTSENGTLGSMIDQDLSVCIQCSSGSNQWLMKEYIKNIFQKLGIADVKHIEFIKRYLDDDYDAYIYMHKWYDGSAVEHLQDKIRDPEREARIVHDDPEYWILKPNRKYLLAVVALDGRLDRFEAGQTHLFNAMSNMKKQLDLQADFLTTQNQSIELINKLLYPHYKKKTPELQQAFVNNSCCGAVSEGWLPSQPSRSDS